MQVCEDVKDYYGKQIRKTGDLLTNVCTIESATFSTAAKEAMKTIHPDVLSKNYGCGAVYPEAVEGCSVLDLGSGAGTDCFVMSKLVGSAGHVVGIDMTPEQLDVARRYIDYHTDKFGYSKPNVEFREGYIEKLYESGLQDDTFDIIISNCVINLSPDKAATLREAYRVLKPGGEMYFSDVYSNQVVPDALRQNKVLWGECLSGALHWKELIKIATDVGFAPPILVKSIVFDIDNPKLNELLESVESSSLKFCSATYRLIKPDKPVQLEQEDNSTIAVTYKGTIKECEELHFSIYGSFQKNIPVIMASSSASLLKCIPRFAPHFTFTNQPQLGNNNSGSSCCSPQEQSASGSTAISYPPLRDFMNVDPFQAISSGSLQTIRCSPAACQSGSCSAGSVQRSNCC